MNKLLFIVLFTGCIFYILFAIYVYKLDKKSLTKDCLLFLCITISFWNLGYAFMLVAENENSANFWRIISTFGWCFFMSAWFNFAWSIRYGSEKRLSMKLLLLSYIPSIIFCIDTFRFKSSEVVVKTSYGWIETNPVNTLGIWFVVYYVIFILAGIFIIYSWGKECSTHGEKKQAQIITITAIISIILASITDIVLPSLGISVFPAAVIVISIAMIGIWHCINKYKMISIEPKDVSDYILKSVKDPIFFLDEDFKIKDTNKQAATMTEYDKAELQDKFFTSLIEENSLDFNDLLYGKDIMNFEINVYGKNKFKIPCLLSGTVIKDDFEDILGIVIVLHNISDRKNTENLLMQYNQELESKVMERTCKLKQANSSLKQEIVDRKAAEKKIQHMAYYDELTGLPNRRYFNEHIKQYVNSIKEKNKYFAIMFLDLDNFKLINDVFGHEKGDALLKEFSFRMTNIIEKNYIFARIGGDEFLLLITDIADQMDINTISSLSNKIIDIFKTPFYINNRENFVTVSIGVALYPKDGEDVETLIKNADIALYQAKNTGKNNCKICSEEIKTNFMEKTKFRNSLYRALEKEELYVYYQPKVDIRLNKIIGFEALLRWKFDHETFISPSEFIPIAEETGLIVPIGYWVINTACYKLKKWHEKGFSNLTMAINISYNQLIEKDFIQKVEEILKAIDLEPSFLEFEVTERITSIGIDENIKVLEHIKSMGIKVSIDDFGTEYSSFMNIKRLPIDNIKIAMEFIQDIERSEKDAAIVNSMVELSHNIGLKVIAEGVETIEQLDYLKAIGCDQVQGYYYYRPMPAEEIGKCLELQKK